MARENGNHNMSIMGLGYVEDHRARDTIERVLDIADRRFSPHERQELIDFFREYDNLRRWADSLEASGSG